MSFVLHLTNNIGPTSVGVNTFITIVLLTLITNCDGGAPLATQNTHFRLILCLILRGGRVALVSPNLRRDMLPWSVGGVTDLPSDAKLASSSSRGMKARGRDLQVPVSANWTQTTTQATKRGFKDCSGFLNSTGRLGPKRGRKCYITPAFSGVPNKGNKIKTQNLRRGSP